MTQPPVDIKADRAQRTLTVMWADGLVVRYPFKFLRGACACAGCVNEYTGERILDVDRIPTDISITDLAPVGNYAMKILWSDDHSSGIYTWDKLRSLASELPRS